MCDVCDFLNTWTHTPAARNIRSTLVLYSDYFTYCPPLLQECHGLTNPFRLISYQKQSGLPVVGKGGCLQGAWNLIPWAGGIYLFWKARILLKLDTPDPPPNPPSSAPTRQKRVPICSFLNSASICILIKTWDCFAESWGKNWDTDAHAHVTYQAPITGLHSPTCIHFFKIPLIITCWHISGFLGIIAASLPWLTPRLG